MFSRVLVTLDGSDLSSQVLPEVARLFEGSNVEVTLLRVSEPPEDVSKPRSEPRVMPAEVAGSAGIRKPSDPKVIETRDQAIAAARDEIARYLDDIAEPLRSAGLTVRTDVAFGHAGDIIPDYARAHDADIIMMATHGRTGVTRSVLGSVADTVVRATVAPVLLVRPRHK